jgi:hypothetical protein
MEDENKKSVTHIKKIASLVAPFAIVLVVLVVVMKKIK